MESVMAAIAPTKRSSKSFAATIVAAGRAVARMIGSVYVALRNRREVARLLAADPAMLRDLGLTPMDLNCALAEPLWRDPSARLLIWSIERRAAARAAARDNLAGLAASRIAPARRHERC
jgi:hypothetical protein